MRKQLISAMLAFTMTFACAACNVNPSASENPTEPEVSTPQNSEANDNTLQVLKSDFELPATDKALQIKAEYLIENNGYKDTDEISAILALPDDALIDRYIESDGKYKSVADFASSWEGERIISSLGAKQQALIESLYNKGLISDVEYTYSTVTNAVAVTTTYGDFKEIEKLTGSKITAAAIADTYALPQAVESNDLVENTVDVYETGIYKPGNLGISGKNTAVAVLDSGFDTTHAVFQRQLNQNEMLIHRDFIDALLNTERANLDGTEQSAADREQTNKEKSEDFSKVNNGKMNALEHTPDLITDNVYYSDKIPYAYDYADRDYDVFPYDSEHGTHVSGIIGGYSEAGYTDKDGNRVMDGDSPMLFTGVAPDTQLVLMKVFPDLDSGARQPDILAALEDAILLEVDAINMSLGASCGFAREMDGSIVNTVYDKLKESGISLITAANNAYTSGFGGENGNTSLVTNPDSGTIGSPASYPVSLSVASIGGKKSKFLYANDEQIIYFDESNDVAGKANNFFDEIFAQRGWDKSETQTVDYVTVPGVGDANSYRGGVNVKGKIALVRRGDNSFEDKVKQAENNGAIGCIIYNNAEGQILMSLGKNKHIPTVSISREAGVKLAEKNSGKIELSYSNEAGPFMSDFSSWGPLANLDLKPEITAHGGSIISSVPNGKFDEMSGTSMACPNLCGLILLIKQYLKEKYPLYDAIEINNITNQILMSTADIVLNEEGNPYSPRKQGAGLAVLENVVKAKGYITVDERNADGTYNSDKIIDKTKFELRDDPKRTGEYVMQFNVKNDSEDAAHGVTGATAVYNLEILGMSESVSASDETHVAEKAHMLSGSFKVEKLSGEGSLSDKKITLEPGQSIKLKLTYTISQDDKDYIDSYFPYGTYVEGFLHLIEEGEGGVNLNAPFLAFYGDWTQAPVFDRSVFEVDADAHNAAIDDEDKVKSDYYTTTPYGSYATNYIVPLGTYLYPIDESQYDYIPASTEHIALSDKDYTIDGILAMFAGCLRCSSEMRYTVTDKVSGEVLHDHTSYNAAKSFSNGGAPVPSYERLDLYSKSLGLVNNRTYEFKMTSKLDYADYGTGDCGAANNVRNSFSFDFVLDNESPVIRAASYEKKYDNSKKKDRYYMTLTLYDNHYVQALFPLLFTSADYYDYLTENPIPVYGERGQDVNVRFEITDMLESCFNSGYFNGYLGFMVTDYALNAQMFIVQLPGTNGNFRFTENGDINGKTAQIPEMNVGDVLDLTQYLATSDPNVDADRDYLKYLNWSSSDNSIVRVERGQALAVAPGYATVTVRTGTPSASLTTAFATTVIRVKAPAGTTISSPVAAGYRNVGIVGESNPATPIASSRDSIQSLNLASYETVYAHPKAGQDSAIGETGDVTLLSGTSGGAAMYPGEQIKLSYDLKPWYIAGSHEVEFISRREDVATVDQNGLIKALKEGTANILVRVKDSPNFVANFTVTVLNEFIKDGYTLVAYKGLGGDVVIPDDEGISYIDPYAFCLYTEDSSITIDDDIYANRTPVVNTTITSVLIPDGITEIRRNAFDSCINLTKVTVASDDIKYIREYAFRNCTSLNEITFVKSPEVIGASAFEGCGQLTSLSRSTGATADDILSHVYAIGDRAFARSGFTSAKLTDLRNAGKEMFADCESLTSVEFNPDGNTKLSDGMFMGTKLTSVTINSATGIPANCFKNCTELETAVIRTTASQMGASAFYGCTKLRELTLPDAQVTYGANVFGNCPALTTLKLGANTTLLGLNRALAGSGVTKFELASGSGYTLAQEDALLIRDGKIILAAPAYEFGTYTIPDGAYTAIGDGAFAGANVTELIINDNDLIIGAYAFANSKLVTLTLPEGGKIKVGEYAFANVGEDGTLAQSPIATINNSESLSSVGAYAFAYGSLTNLNVGSEAEIGAAAFMGSKVNKLNVADQAKLGERAFMDCNSLSEAVLSGTVSLGESCFENDKSLGKINLGGVTAIPNRAFAYCSALVEADLTNAESIGNSAFLLCSNLASVTLSKVVSIGDYAFAGKVEDRGYDAPRFTSINFPATLTSLGEYSFAGCGLTTITLPAGMTKVTPRAFIFCRRLNRVNLSDTITEIGEQAFAGCTTLAAVTGGAVQTVGVAAFSGDTALSSFPFASLITAERESFAGTSALRQVNSPNLESALSHSFDGAGLTSFTAPKLQNIGDYAFAGAALTSFTFSSDLKSVGVAAFDDCTRLQSFRTPDDKEDGDINSYATLNGGVLYTKMTNGKVQLSSVPAAKRFEGGTFTVPDGTVRIRAYAGNENKSVTKIILPDSLQSIENFAFYGYTNLTTVEFKSSVAPRLENFFVGEEGDNALSQNDPGYGLLHGFWEFGNWMVELSYYNFVDLMGKIQPLKMILPANSTLEGYDAIEYEGYFGKSVLAERSSYVAMEKAMRQFIEYGEKVQALENVTLGDEELVLAAVTAKNAVKQDYKTYNVPEEEWTALNEAVDGAMAKITEIKKSVMTKTARDVQARIDQLPSTYDGSTAQEQLYQDITVAINSLRLKSDKDALDLTKYNVFKAAHDSYVNGGGSSDNPGGDTPVTPPDLGNEGGGNCSGCGTTSIGDGMIIGGSAFIVTLMMIAAVHVIRKKRNK